ARLARRRPGPAGPLLRDGAAPGVAGRALLLLDDDAAPPRPGGLPVRGPAAAVPPGAHRGLPRGGRLARRELHRHPRAVSRGRAPRPAAPAPGPGPAWRARGRARAAPPAPPPRRSPHPPRRTDTPPASLPRPRTRRTSRGCGGAVVRFPRRGVPPGPGAPLRGPGERRRTGGRPPRTDLTLTAIQPQRPDESSC